eukprot:RCo010807
MSFRGGRGRGGVPRSFNSNRMPNGGRGPSGGGRGFMRREDDSRGYRSSSVFGNREGRTPFRDEAPPSGFRGRSMGSRDFSATRPLNEDPNYHREEIAAEELLRSTPHDFNFDNVDELLLQNMSGQDVQKYLDQFPKSFADLAGKLHSALMKNISSCGYRKLTPAQQLAFPVLFDDRDIVLVAQTGSGKTAAFLLPMINGILSASGKRSGYPQGIIIVPTRELCCQIYDDARKFCYGTDVHVGVAYGGVKSSFQEAQLQDGCDILVCTPGRMKDFLERDVVRLDSIRYAVMDEADEMLNMGFMPDMENIFGHGMPDTSSRVTGMFSATFPEELQKLASRFLHNVNDEKLSYVFARVAERKVVPHGIHQFVEKVESSWAMNDCLKDLVDQNRDSLFLVFVKTKLEAMELEQQLGRMRMNVEALHGDKSQQARENALKRFKQRKTTVLLATDVASRGLDIPHCDFVVNMGVPRNVDIYIHRIGRTGRCGQEGTAVTFHDGTNQHALSDLVEVLQKNHQKVPDWMLREA